MEKAEFIGYLYSNVLPPVALFNVDLGYGKTTVSAQTLTREGIEVPPHPPEESENQRPVMNVSCNFTLVQTKAPDYWNTVKTIQPTGQ